MQKAMTLLQKSLSFFDDDYFFKYSLSGLVIALFLWCLCLAPFHETHGDLISSTRLLIETSVVLYMLHMSKKNFMRWLFNIVVLIASLNSIVVVLQILETSQCLSMPFHRISTDIWHIHTEYTRKPGIFNGFQTSSFFSFFALILLIHRKDWISIVLCALNIFSIFFGARSILFFLPFILLFNWRVVILIFFLLVLLFSFSAFQQCSNNFSDLMKTHLRWEIFPAVSAIVEMNPNTDPSSRDTMTQYRTPESTIDTRAVQCSATQILQTSKKPAKQGFGAPTLQKGCSLDRVLNKPATNMFASNRDWVLLKLWLFGNGMPRYSQEGGRDPMFSRWFLQAGLPAAILASLISIWLGLRIIRKERATNIIFVLALLLTTIKAELMTATIIYTILLAYALSTPFSTRPFWIKEKREIVV